MSPFTYSRSPKVNFIEHHCTISGLLKYIHVSKLVKFRIYNGLWGHKPWGGIPTGREVFCLCPHLLKSLRVRFQSTKIYIVLFILQIFELCFWNLLICNCISLWQNSDRAIYNHPFIQFIYFKIRNRYTSYRPISI